MSRAPKLAVVPMATKPATVEARLRQAFRALDETKARRVELEKELAELSDAFSKERGLTGRVRVGVLRQVLGA